MRYGFVLPGGTARQSIDRAVAAEEAGWEAVFLAEGPFIEDPWVVLGAVAERTSTIRLGSMLTPLPWRRPWKLAGQAATLDHISGGRAVLAVGTGATEVGLIGPPDAASVKERAELLDEGIDIITGLWSGERAFHGSHYDFDLTDNPFQVLAPLQQPRLPIWCVGAWPRMKSMRRVLKADGLLPLVFDPSLRMAEPADLQQMVGWLAEQGVPATYDVIKEGETPTDNPASWPSIVQPWRDAGATWWLESRWGAPDQTDGRIAAGPPAPRNFLHPL